MTRYFYRNLLETAAPPLPLHPHPRPHWTPSFKFQHLPPYLLPPLRLLLDLLPLPSLPLVTFLPLESLTSNFDIKRLPSHRGIPDHLTMGQNQVIFRHQKFTFPRAREFAK